MQVGTVVRILRGHDAPGYAVVVACGEREALLVNGKRRPLERPKRKNLRHLRATDVTLSAAALQSDRQIRKALRAYAATNNP